MTVGPWNGLCITPDQWARYSDNDLRKDAYNIYGPQYASDGSEIIDGATEEPLNINPVLPALYMTANGGFTINQYRNTGARVGKYEIAMGAKENLNNDFPVFRLSDFYLMKAEVMVRQGGAGAGDAYITPIRTRAGLGAASGFGLDDLLDERARELYVEGHRRQDLIRYGLYTGGNYNWAWKGNAQNGVAIPLNLAVYPIPNLSLSSNPNLTQNPGY